MIKISIIILNYNTADYSEKLIKSLESNLDMKDIEIILIDNNSTDKSYRNIREKFPFIRLIENNENYGFALGNNIAANNAKGKYLLFLNPDVFISNNVVFDLLNYYEQNTNIGILSGLMIDEVGNPLYCFNKFWGVEWELYQLLGNGYKWKINKMLSRNEISDNTPFEVDWFHGAFIFIRSDIFKKIGGFNEKHFMYCEDIELCYDVKNKLGLKNICLPYVTFLHETRSTFKELSKDDLYFFHTNRGKLIFIENYDFAYKNIIKLLSLAGIIVRLMALPFWGKYKGRKSEKFIQLLKIIKLHLNKIYLLNSKYEFVNQ